MRLTAGVRSSSFTVGLVDCDLLGHAMLRGWSLRTVRGGFGTPGSHKGADHRPPQRPTNPEPFALGPQLQSQASLSLTLAPHGARTRQGKLLSRSLRYGGSSDLLLLFSKTLCFFG